MIKTSDNHQQEKRMADQFEKAIAQENFRSGFIAGAISGLTFAFVVVSIISFIL